MEASPDAPPSAVLFMRGVDRATPEQRAAWKAAWALQVLEYRRLHHHSLRLDGAQLTRLSWNPNGSELVAGFKSPWAGASGAAALRMILRLCVGADIFSAHYYNSVT